MLPDEPVLPAPPTENLPSLAAVSILDFMVEAIKKPVKKAMHKRPELFGLPERELRQLLRSSGVTLTPTDTRLQIRCWDLFDRCVAGNLATINTEALCAGVCSGSFLVADYLRKPQKCAWLMTPPARFDIVAKEALAFGMEQLRDILELSHVDPITNKVNTALVNIKLRILQMLDLRAHGAPTQRQVNLNIGASSQEVNALAEQMTMEALQKKIAELDKLDRQAQHVESTAIDVALIED